MSAILAFVFAEFYGLFGLMLFNIQQFLEVKFIALLWLKVLCASQNLSSCYGDINFYLSLSALKSYETKIL